MATIALFAVGSAVAGPVGGFIGAAAGSYIDSQFVYPAIFGTPDHQNLVGPRLDDLRLQTAKEGSPVNFCQGPFNRMAGTIIWLSDLIEVASSQSIDGKGGSGGGGTHTSYSYFVNVAIGVCEGEIGEVLKIWADGKVIYDNTEQPETVASRYTSLTIYKGTDSQTADSTISAEEGAAETPAFLHTAYVVIERLALKDFGNRVPNFSFLVQEPDTVGGSPGTRTVAEAIGNILDRTAITSSQYNTDLCEGCLLGYQVAGPQETSKILEPLLLTFEINVKEVDGVLHFISRGFETEHTISASDLAAHGDDGTLPDAFVIADTAESELPAEVVVNHVDPGNDYQTGTQRERRSDSLVQTEHVLTLNIPVVLSAVEAKKLAFRRLWGEWAERRRVTMHLPVSYVGIEESDILNTTYNGETYRTQVIRITRGHNGVLEIESQTKLAATKNIRVSVERPGGGVPPKPYTPPTTTLIVKNLPPMQDEHVAQPGYYWTAAPDSLSQEWIGGDLYRSFDGTNFSAIRYAPRAGTIGTVTGGLLSAGVDPSTWDRVSKPRVTLTHGTLSSATELEVLNGVNHMLIGDEIIGFVNATLISTGVYELDTLLRGRRGTERHMSTHGAPLYVAQLLPNLVDFIPIQISAIGASRSYKAVPSGGTVSDYAAQTFTPTGATMLPWAPTHVAGSRDGSNNLTITWTYRTRIPWRHFNTLSMPYLIHHNGYEVDVYDPTDLTSIVRTISVNAETETASYTAAQQTTDGLTPGDDVPIKVYELHELLGRGFGTEFIEV